MSDAPKVGDKCWVWNINSRVYVDGKVSTRGHFREATIDGETRLSWIVGEMKFAKDTLGWRDANWGSHCRLYLTERSVDDHCFVTDHAYRIGEKVRQCDAATLRKVAEIVGYDAKEPR